MSHPATEREAAGREDFVYQVIGALARRLWEGVLAVELGPTLTALPRGEAVRAWAHALTPTAAPGYPLAAWYAAQEVLAAFDRAAGQHWQTLAEFAQVRDPEQVATWALAYVAPPASQRFGELLDAAGRVAADEGDRWEGQATGFYAEALTQRNDSRAGAQVNPRRPRRERSARRNPPETVVSEALVGFVDRLIGDKRDPLWSLTQRKTQRDGGLAVSAAEVRELLPRIEHARQFAADKRDRWEAYRLLQELGART